MLFDGISLTEGSDIKNLTVDTGIAFVPTPTDGELFYINSTSSGNPLGLYVYSMSNSTWERVVLDTDTLSSSMITSALGYTPLNKAGDTMSGALLLSADPTVSSQAATKNYVDAAIAGLSWKNEVACATTANITLSGEQTIDGVTTSASRVLVKNQTTASQNGIYLSGSGAWTRTTDADVGTEIIGSAVYVDAGTVNAASAWVNTNTAITLGTTPIVFAQFGGGATYSAGTGLSLTGNVFANTGVTSLVAGSNITLSGSTGAVTISSTSAAGSTLTGTSLASNIISSSLTSVGTLSTLTVSGTIYGTTNGNLAFDGGTLTGALLPYTANVTVSGTNNLNPTQLNADINYINTLSGTTTPTVMLPDIAAGREVTIINDTAYTITAYAGTQSQLRGTNCYIYPGSSITLVGTGHFTTGDPAYPFWVATASPIQAGTGITVSQPNEYNTQFATTITNSGVTSLVAGTGISLSGSTGVVTISSTGGTGTITSVSGTANQITASTVSGAVTLSLPSAISGITSISATTFTGALSGNASTATTAGTVTTAAQPNITSVGTLTSLTVSGTITGHASLDLPLTGGTMSGALILNADPVAGLGAATKNYVDAAIAGLSWKNEVACATTANITLSGEQTIDGITTSSSRVLVKNQTTASQNGIYLSGSGAWTRTTDMTTSAQILGSAVYVDGGTTQSSNAFVNTNTSVITIDTTSITFVQFSGGATYTAGTGLSLVGNTFNNTGVTSIVAGSGISISGSTGAVTVTASAISIPAAQIPFGTGSGVTSSSLLTFTGTSSTNNVLTIGTYAIGTGNTVTITSTATTPGGGGSTLQLLGSPATVGGTNGGNVLIQGGASFTSGSTSGGITIQPGISNSAGNTTGNVTINTNASTGSRGGNINIGTNNLTVLGINGTTGNLAVAAPQTTFTGSINFYSTNFIVAAGTTQATATALTADNNFVTSVAAGTGVTLPAGAAGREISVVNRGANPLMVYPASGAQIDGAGTNIGVSVPVNAAFVVNAQTSAQWCVLTPVYAAGTGVIITQSNNGTVTFASPAATAILQNSQSAAYTCVLADAGGQIFHPATDTTARTWTIPANSTVAYPIGTTLTFINQNGAGTISIIITTDTMTLAGATASTGPRTLATNGLATAIKIGTTSWIISGVNLA
jgi:hypothetical protein